MKDNNVSLDPGSSGHILMLKLLSGVSGEIRAVKRVDGSQVDPFNSKNFKVRVLVFPTRLNPGFFGPDRISSRPDRASPRLTGWPRFFYFFLVFSFLLIMKNTFNFNTNHNFFTSFLKSFFFFLSILKKLLMNNNIFSISTI